MAKDKKINEIPGISGAAVVQLTRIGVVTMHDLVHADFDRVAYVLEDYKEATRLVGEAQKQLSRGRRGGASTESKAAKTGDSLVDHVVHTRPVSSSMDEPAPARHAAPEPAPSAASMAFAGGGGAGESASIPGMARSAPRGGAAQSATGASGESLLGSAMAMASRGVSLSAAGNTEARLALARRVSVAELLLRLGGTETEVLAGLLTEPVEHNAVTPQEALSRFGPEVWHAIEQAMALRAVPLLPSGRPPKYYLDMAQGAEPAARRVCAAHLVASLEAGGGSVSLLHARLLLEALSGGDEDELIELAASAVERAAGAAETRRAA